MEHSIHEEVPKHKITLYSTLKGALGAHMPGLSLKQKLEVREWKLESLRPPIYPTGPWDIRFQRASGKPFAIGECLNGVTDKNMIGVNEEVMFTSPNQPIELRLLVSDTTSSIYNDRRGFYLHGFEPHSTPSSLTRNCASASKLQDIGCRWERCFGTLLPWLNDATTRSG